MSRVVVIGGGAAGMTAAIFAAKNSHQVLLLEKNEKLGKKIYITGKGRCNLTNRTPAPEFFDAVFRNPKFFYKAFYHFSNEDMIALLSSAGLSVKTERGQRVFPLSDHASDVTKALTKLLRHYGVEIHLSEEVTGLTEADGKIRKVCTSEKEYECDAVILATGGLSYALTGSTGKGHELLRELSVSLTELYPALTGLKTEEDFSELSGLTLKNVSLTLFHREKKVYRGFGELLFTKEGISGPIVLSGSSYVTEALGKGEIISGEIDLKPAVSENELQKRLLSDFTENPNKELATVLRSYFPQSFIPVFLNVSGVSGEQKIHDIRKTERTDLINKIKRFPLTVKATGDFSEAVITRGGVSLKEVSPNTLALKKIPNLYVAGELLDLDAATGGYNLQIAWSNGALAGHSIS